MSLRLQFVVLFLVGWITRHQQDVVEYLRAENRVLREQLGGRRLRLTDPQRARLARKGKRLGRKLLGEVATIVTPDTILRWYRRLVAEKYSSPPRSPAATRVAEPIAALVVRIAQENPTFGYTRIRDAVQNLGRSVSRTSVANVLAANGIDPAPERGERTPWATFLAAHWETLAAADFFTVEVLSAFGLVRCHVLVVMELCTRRVELVVVRQPSAAWVKQTFRNTLDTFDGFLRDTTHLILDRNPLFTKDTRDLLKVSGVEVVRLPRRSPNLNAYAERFIRSIKSECLGRMILFGEAHLRRVVAEYAEHYHRERNHQGLESRLIDPGPEVGRADGPVRCRTRLGGTLRYYYREAA